MVGITYYIKTRIFQLFINEGVIRNKHKKNTYNFLFSIGKRRLASYNEYDTKL